MLTLLLTIFIAFGSIIASDSDLKKVTGLFAVCVHGHHVHGYCKKVGGWAMPCPSCRESGSAELLSSSLVERRAECVICIEGYEEPDDDLPLGYIEARNVALFSHWLKSSIPDGSLTSTARDYYAGIWVRLQGRLSTKLLKTKSYSNPFDLRHELTVAREAAIKPHWPDSCGPVPVTRKILEEILETKIRPE